MTDKKRLTLIDEQTLEPLTPNRLRSNMTIYKSARHVTPILLLLVIFSVAALAHGQSACEQLGINCRPPRTDQRPGPSGNGNSGSQESPNKQLAAEHYAAGREAQARYRETRNLGDWQTAVNEFTSSWNLHRDGAIHLTELYGSVGDAESTLKWTIAAKGEINKGARPWLEMMHSWSLQKIAVDEYQNKCVMTTDRSQPGLVVTPDLDIMQQAKLCERLAKNRDHLIEEYTKKKAKFEKETN